MTDFLSLMDADLYGELIQQIATRAKPTNTMSAIEWAEYEALEALEKAEHAKAKVLYVRVTGEAPAS